MRIIKLRPLTTSVDERVVVARLSCSTMNNNTLEIVQYWFSIITMKGLKSRVWGNSNQNYSSS